jgi:hypothetical protein
VSYSESKRAAAGEDYPGRMLGIVGLVVAIVASLIGLVISAVAFSQSKKAGYKNTPALIGMIVGGVFFVLTVVSAAIGIAGAALYTGV